MGSHQLGAANGLLRLAMEFSGIGSHPGADGADGACRRAGVSDGLRWGRGRRGGPIGLSELHAPETRRRGEELEADALSLLRGIAQINDAALLLFLGEGVDQHDHRAVFDRLVQIEQPAVRVNDNGFANLAEFPAVDVLAGGYDTHTHEHAGAAASFGILDLGHVAARPLSPGMMARNNAAADLLFRQ